MRRFVAGTISGFLASSVLTFASGGVAHTANFWNELNGAAKYGYICGYSDALRVARVELDELKIAANVFDWKGAPIIIQTLSDQLSTSDLPPEVALRELNTLYANPHYRDLDLGSALELLTIHTNQLSAVVERRSSPASQK